MSKLTKGEKEITYEALRRYAVWNEDAGDLRLQNRILRIMGKVVTL
jgi:hypothetical protein